VTPSQAAATKRPRVAIFLRGINVGAYHRVTMSTVVATLREGGIEVSRTILQSGNLVAETDASAADVTARVRHTLSTRLGFDVPCVTLDRETFLVATDAHPLAQPGRDDRLLTVAFSDPVVDDATFVRSGLEHLGPELVRRGASVIYQWCPTGVSKSVDVVRTIDRVTGGVSTLRNWRTLQLVRGAMVA